MACVSGALVNTMIRGTDGGSRALALLSDCKKCHTFVYWSIMVRAGTNHFVGKRKTSFQNIKVVWLLGCLLFLRWNLSIWQQSLSWRNNYWSKTYFLEHSRNLEISLENDREWHNTWKYSLKKYYSIPEESGLGLGRLYRRWCNAESHEGYLLWGSEGIAYQAHTTDRIRVFCVWQHPLQR